VTGDEQAVAFDALGTICVVSRDHEETVIIIK
jgi:hypothetical protein